MSKLKIATWNLQHASTKGPPVDLQIARLRTFNPDVIVLTETDDEVDLSEYGYHGAHAEKNDYEKYCSAIWSKFPFTKSYPTYEPATAVCRRVDTPLGPLIVYGTLITYKDDGVKEVGKRPWEEHIAAIKAQGKDWSALRKQTNEAIPLCVAGDFNQTRGGSYRYATKETVKLLSENLAMNNLKCLTEEDFGATGKLKDDPKKGYPRSNIDHVCVTSGFAANAQANVWDHFTDSEIYLSDHNGVYVDFY